jgi:two-component system invasion response regulator UvrY
LSDNFSQGIHNQGVALASVLLVEDDVFTRSTLAAALVGANFEVRAKVGKAADAIQAVQKFSIDVAILDLDLGPGANGVDIAVALREVNPGLGIIILTSYTDPRVIDPRSTALPKGSRFVTKSQLTDLSPLIRMILEIKSLPLSEQYAKRGNKVDFTATQLIVLQGVAEGLTTKAIAFRTGVTEKAVEGTITRLHSMLGLPKKSSLNPRVQLARAYFVLSGKKPPGA